MRKLMTLLFGAQLLLVPGYAYAQGVEADPAIQPSVAPEVAPTVAPEVAPTVAPEVAPTVAPGVAPSVAPTVAPGVAPAVTIAPEVHMPLSDASLQASAHGAPTIVRIIGLPLGGRNSTA